MNTGTYRINDTDLTIQPTYGKWLPREIVDYDGNGHPIYPPYREFEMGWNLSAPEQVHQLQDFFNTIGRTGTASVDLPKYAYEAYFFQTYSGTVLQEPAFDLFFSEHYTSVILLVSKIRIS